MIKNYKIVLQYDGSRYDGWQKQGNTGNTIQGKLEGILLKLTGRPVEVHGSGRTDAGVHALAQTANFHADTGMTEDQIRAYFNQYLPEDIAVLSVEKVPDKFHSRLNAVQKTYLYRIEMGPKKDVFERKYCYGLGKQLSADRMKEAAACVLGEHDFKSFCGNKKMKKSTVGFLYHMVRILTGTLIEIGLEERSPQEMKEILLKLDRQAAGFTAPPEGLFLERVMYEDRE